MVYKIGVLEGDDIGPEVVQSTIKVLKQSISNKNIEIEWNELPIGYSSYLENGTTMPQSTLDTLKQLDAWILGPIGHAVYPKDDPKAFNPHPIIRKTFELNSNIRPFKSYPNIHSVHDDVDIVVVRENNEGFQPDRNMHIGSGEFMPTPDMAMSLRVITRNNSTAVAESAFKLASQRNNKVTALHKDSVFKLGCGLFLDSCRKIAKNYPDVQYSELQIDASAAALVMNPQQFDVIVTTNMFGDIISDLAAGLVGGLGMAPGLSAGSRYVMAQATHGSAPDIAGKNIANPYAMIMSGKQLFEFLGTKKDDQYLLQSAKNIEEAVTETIEAGTVTPDLGGSSSTSQMVDAICSYLVKHCYN